LVQGKARSSSPFTVTHCSSIQMAISTVTLWFVGHLLFLAANPATAGKAASCSTSGIDEEILDTQGDSLLHMGAHAPKPASSKVKAKASMVTTQIANERSKGSRGLQATLERARRWQQQSGSFTEAAKSVKARMPRQKTHTKHVSKEFAMNVTTKYIKALTDVGAGKLGPYLDQFCERFQAVDPVGTLARTSKDQYKRALQYRRALTMPKGFVLEPKVITIAQEYAYTAVYSSMVVHNKAGKKVENITMNRADLLTISPLGCVKRVSAYWSLASLLKTQVSAEHTQTKEVIHGYLKALDDLGHGKNYDYFGQFDDEFEVHDPFGTAPMTMVKELQTVIPELGSKIAPKGFSVTTKDVTVATDPKFGTAHLVLNIVGGPSVDIIDFFEVTKKVKSLKAVWHLV